MHFAECRELLSGQEAYPLAPALEPLADRVLDSVLDIEALLDA